MTMSHFENKVFGELNKCDITEITDHMLKESFQTDQWGEIKYYINNLFNFLKFIFHYVKPIAGT